MEIYFRPLTPDEIGEIAANAIAKIGFPESPEAVDVVKRYATNGREAVNIVQLAAGLAMTDKRGRISAADVEWVVANSQIQPRPDKKIPSAPQIGVVNGLAVYGPGIGSLLEIEVTAFPTLQPNTGKVTITGVVDEEEIGGGSKTLRRKSMARGSVENVLTVLRHYGIEASRYDLHINFPGGAPVDGPSAGIAVATAIASAVSGIPVDNRVAMTGELSIHGKVKPVGGITGKVEAAFQAGAGKVLIPKDNWQEMFTQYEGLEIVRVDKLDDVFEIALGRRMFHPVHADIQAADPRVPAAVSVLRAGEAPDGRG
jgi:Lon-like ATP-dependent protease